MYKPRDTGYNTEFYHSSFLPLASVAAQVFKVRALLHYGSAF